MRRVLIAALGILMMPSTGLAQDVSESGGKAERTLYIDYFPLRSHPASSKALSDEDSEPELPAPLEDTFLLHSNPGASKVIYLDFDGHMIMWAGEEFYYDPWNMEGPDTTFSDTERTVIQLAWQSISEDFLPFDLDITTEDPGVEALRNTGGDDDEWGVRAVINHSTDSYSWAYGDTFSDSEDTEFYIWSGPDPSVYETWIWIADSVSHEAGHTLGLSHDGTTAGIEYYRGHGSGDTAWSPIMGWTNYGLSQWDRGEYTDANNHQNDLTIITTRNGFGYRPDDHGSTTGTATAIDVDLFPVAEGIIERPTDVDYFAFNIVSDENRIITISPDNLAPNLDIAATIFDSDGAALFVSNPPTTLGAEFEVFLPAGDYYLSVDGTGYDDPHSDGYSDYGTLGYYIIESYADEAIGDTGDGSDTGEIHDTGDISELEDSGGSEDSGGVEDSGGFEDSEESADSGGSDHVKKGDAGADASCSCTNASASWPGSVLLLPLLLIRRRASPVVAARTHHGHQGGGGER